MEFLAAPSPVCNMCLSEDGPLYEPVPDVRHKKLTSSGLRWNVGYVL